METTSAIVVLCTCPDEAVAGRIARALVEERLAACVNRVPGVRSTYRWKDAVQDDPEVLLLIKSVEANFPALRDRIVALHPYELPEVIAVKVGSGLDRYLAWVASETTPHS
jgi:periplasmic divalent cation tolerance protein